jgi:SAM-dependent methyltransferase
MSSDAEPGLEVLTHAQRGMWGRGDFHRIGVAQLVVGELLVRALRVGAGERVLDVGGGAGNTALAAARRFAEVTCSDYVPALLDRARVRAHAEGLPLALAAADAQGLPFADSSFDVVVSTFGAMFAPDQLATAAELLRVLRPGGRLGMANWTPDSWVGEHFALQSRYRKPSPGLRPPSAWGTRQRLQELIGPEVEAVETVVQHMDFVHRSVGDLWDQFRSWFGPLSTLLDGLDPVQRHDFERAWFALAERHNVATDGTCVIPSAYLQVMAVRRPVPPRPDDPDWRYVKVRRTLMFLEHSIDAGLAWVVFEPNGEELWERVRETVSAFLTSQWREGELLGSRAEEAFFVRCDRDTMTQNDLQNGRLVCEIGVAVARPAEFVTFRIGQWTAVDPCP